LSSDSLEQFARRRLEALDRRSLHRSLRTIDRGTSPSVRIGDTELISFACNDYLGLASDPLTRDASIAATQIYGAGAGASRLISGNHTLYRDLEQRLANIKGTPSAVVFGSGYLTNIGVIPVFAGAADLVLVDSSAHSSLLTGAELSGATTKAFAHNDANQLEGLLAAHRTQFRNCLVLTEGVFSMDGDLAPLPRIAAVTKEHDAWLLTDDAHGLGVIGGGRGSTFAHATAVEIPLQMGTLSKAVGAYGGYLCASEAVIDLVRNRARSFVYSTGLPPGTVASAIAALEIIATDKERVARPLTHARTFTNALNLPQAESAIVPILVGSASAALAASDALRIRGFLVPAIRPPTVAASTSRLRFSFSSTHSEDQIEALIGAVNDLGIES
jgi:8-amino-7-oxononanoate synthase